MYDGIVLCMTASRIFPPKKNIQFGTVKSIRANTLPCKKGKLYYEKWPIVNNVNGYLYQFFDSDGQFSEFNCCDDLFEFKYSDDLPTQNINTDWLHYSKKNRTSCRISIKQKCANDFAAFLQWALLKSDAHQIMFLCYGETWPFPQTPVIGIFKLSSFIRQLSDGNIYTDICYIISDLSHMSIES